MTTRWPSAVSSLCRPHNGSIRLSTRNRIAFHQHSCTYYSTTPPSKPTQDDVNRPEKAALVEITGLRKLDPINPPRSTLPADLNLPERGDKNLAAYYYRIGRAYGSFYFTGVKAVWFNYQACNALRERLKKAQAQDGGKKELLAYLNRSEFQLLARNRHDISKLPFFGLLVAVFGEWLPLLVPFIPSAVPGTCRIPKQIRGMRAKAEERRRLSFRKGIGEPTKGQLLEGGERALVKKEVASQALLKLKDDQLLHLSCNLNNHNRLWDRVQLPPPSALLRRGLAKRLAYITSDDKLLNAVDKAAERLTPDELAIACEERGIDLLGKSEQTMRRELSQWLDRQKQNKGAGKTLMVLLFRRPNAWATKV